MSRRKHHEEEHENHERWLITYADVITLLMAFFVMMYAMATLDAKKFEKFRQSARSAVGKDPCQDGNGGVSVPADAAAGGCGGDAGPTATPSAAPSATPAGGGPANVTRERLDTLRGQMEDRLAKAGLKGKVGMRVEDRGLVIYLTDKVLFDSGESAVRPDGMPVLRQIGSALDEIGNPIIVEGHTDDVPIVGGSNWDLSTLRATSVVRVLIDDANLPPRRITAAGYADTRPRVRGTSDAARARNRRVEIVVSVS